ncbi:spermatogenesis-associated protein 31A1-like [Dasypus novemcinctus]|uniref:spermatogenesis-associated protein 31A1-like n=1 Tax=Dasypus novemcinctus TaxID=9361 RepID=UPI00265E5EBE|nr:spermatogenesis-associated protein 31A1-like [Dasypus novemcinctus]
MALPLSTYDNSWLAAPDPATLGLGGSRRPLPAFWWQSAAEASLLPTSTHCESQPARLPHPPPEDSFWGGPVMRHGEAGSPCLFNPNIQKPLEIQVTKRVEFRIWKESDFLKSGSPDSPLTSLENKMKSLGDEQGPAAPQPFWSTKDKPVQLLSPQQLSYHITLQDHLKEKCSQLFWGLPSLHSESLIATAWVSGSASPLGSSSFFFNTISNSYLGQVQPTAPSLLSQYRLHSGAPPQPWIPNMPQSQPPFLWQLRSRPPPLARVGTPAQLQSSLPVLPPSSLPQTEAPGGFCSTAQNKTPSAVSTESQSAEWPLWQKRVENGCSLSSVVNSSREAFTPLTYSLSQDSHASWDHRPVSAAPAKLSLGLDLQKLLEQHLQQRLTQHRQGVAPRMPLSLEPMQPQGKSPGACKAKANHGPPQPTAFTGQGSKRGDENLGLRPPERSPAMGPEEFLLGKGLGKGLLQKLGEVPKRSPPKGLESCPVKVLKSDPEKKLKNVWTRHRENHLPRLSDQKHREDALSAHLGRKLEQVSGGGVPVRVRRSRLAAHGASPCPDAHVKARSRAFAKGWPQRVNTCQELSFLQTGTQQVLEAHSKRFWVKRKWDLPLKVLRPIKLLKARKAQAAPLELAPLAASAPHHSGARVAEMGKVLGTKLQMCQQETVTTKSGPALGRPLPAPFPAFEEIQGVLGQTPPGHGRGRSEAPPAGQEGRQPPWPGLAGIPWESGAGLGAPRGSPEPTPCQATTEDERSKESGGHTPGAARCVGAALWREVEAQASWAEARGEAGQADGSPACRPQCGGILGTCERANSPALSVDLSGFGDPGTSASSTPLETPAAPAPGHLCSIAQVVRELEIQVKVEPENEPGEGPPGALLGSDSLGSDSLASRGLDCRLRGTAGGIGPASCVLDGHAGGSRARPRGALESQGETFAAAAEQEDGCWPELGEHGVRAVRFTTSAASRTGQLSQARGVADTPGSKYLHLLPEKAQAAPESRFRRRVRRFLQWVFPSRTCGGQEDEPGTASAQGRRPGKRRPFLGDSGAAEAQTLMLAVGQMLEAKMALQATGRALRARGARAGRCSCCLPPKAPFSPGRRAGRGAPACRGHSAPEGQGSPGGEAQGGGQSALESPRSRHGGPGSCRRRLPLLPPLSGLRSPGAHHCWPWAPRTPACPHHCPRHCVWGGALLTPPEGAAPGSSSSKISLQENICFM